MGSSEYVLDEVGEEKPFGEFLAFRSIHKDVFPVDMADGRTFPAL